MIQFQTDGRTEAQTDRHRILPATAGGPLTTIVVDWHLKVKEDIEYNVSLTKNYCITVSMQKLSSVHTLICKTQQVLGSQELNGHTHF